MTDKQKNLINKVAELAEDLTGFTNDPANVASDYGELISLVSHLEAATFELAGLFRCTECDGVYHRPAELATPDAFKVDEGDLICVHCATHTAEESANIRADLAYHRDR